MQDNRHDPSSSDPSSSAARDLVILGLGANLESRFGPPAATLAWAAGRLEKMLEGLRVAPLYRSAPISAIPQPDYLNTVAMAAKPRLSPRRLLGELKELERQAGRGTAERDAPRVLDLDLLVFGDLQIEEADLSLPHPRLRGRLFVLAPLFDLAPRLELPPDGRTVEELHAALAGSQRIERL